MARPNTGTAFQMAKQAPAAPPPASVPAASVRSDSGRRDPPPPRRESSGTTRRSSSRRRGTSRGPSYRDDRRDDRHEVVVAKQFDEFDRAPEDRHKDPQGTMRKMDYVTDFFGPYEAVVRGSLHIEGVNYAKYEAQKHRQSYIAAFLDALRDDIISEVGNGVRREDILLNLYPGAIKTVVLHYDRYDGPDPRTNDPKLVDAEWSVKCDYAIRARDVQRQQNIAIALYTALGEEQLFTVHKMRKLYIERFDPNADPNKVCIIKPPQEGEQRALPQQQIRGALPSPPRPMPTQMVTSPTHQPHMPMLPMHGTPPRYQQQQQAQGAMPQNSSMRMSPMPQHHIAMQQHQQQPQPPQQQQQQPLGTPHSSLAVTAQSAAVAGDVFDSPYRMADSSGAGGAPAYGGSGAQNMSSSFVGGGGGPTSYAAGSAAAMPPMAPPAGPSGSQSSPVRPTLLHNAPPVGSDGWMEVNGKRGVAVFIPEEALLSTPQGHRLRSSSFAQKSESPYPSMTKTPPSLLAP